MEYIVLGAEKIIFLKIKGIGVEVWYGNDWKINYSINSGEHERQNINCIMGCK